MGARQAQILEIIVRVGAVEVASLADSLDVSQVTIRKDLDSLESRGLVRRERGMAVPVSSDDPAGRIAYHYADKMRIARAAAARIEDGELVMIEAGSCCSLLAEEIARTKPGTTIVTNSAFIAHRIRNQSFSHSFLLGGEYQNDSQVLVGPMIELCAGQFLADKLFIGTDGFTARHGFTGRDHMRVAAVHTMMKRSENVIVLTESEKFGQHGPIPLVSADQVDVVWTDSSIGGDFVHQLVNDGISVNTVNTELAVQNVPPQ